MTSAPGPSRPSLGVALGVAALHLAASGVVVLDEVVLTGAGVGVAVGTVLAVAQAGAVVGLRARLLPAFLVFCALTATASALFVPWSGVGWLAMVYLVIRHGAPRAVSVVAATTAAVYLVSAAADVLVWGADVALTGRWLVEVVVVVGVQVALAVLAGWARRALEMRAREAREEDLRRRRDAALVQERRRIGDELDTVVVEHLQRVAALASTCRARLADPHAGQLPVLTELQQEARRTLTTMRRVLTVVRADTRPAGDPGSPRTRRPPLPTTGGIVLGAVAAAATMLAAVLARAPGVPSDVAALLQVDTPSLLAPVLVGVQIAVLGWWRSAPVAALLIGTTAALGAFVAGIPTSIADLGWLLLAYGVAVERPLRVSAPLLIGTFLALSAPLLLVPGAAPIPMSGVEILANIAVWLGLAALVWMVGSARRARRIRRDTRAGHDLRRTVEQERHRIARELHDVVAQLVSAVAVQAGAAQAVVDTDPRVFDELVGHIEEHGGRIRSALPNLMMLSRPTDVVTLDEVGVEHLVAALRTAGLPVVVQVGGEPDDGRGETALFAQRILVEALTNVLRHAGPSPTRVSIDHRPDEVRVEVVDSGRAPSGPAPLISGDGAGLGLVGMRERAALLGGTVEAGPDPAGGWRVVARLPQQQLAVVRS